MRHKILRKFIFLYLLFFVLSLALTLWIVPSAVYDYLFIRTGDRLQQTAEVLSESQEISRCAYQQETEAGKVKNLLDAIAAVQKSEVWLVNEEGRVLMCSRYGYPMQKSMNIPDFNSLGLSNTLRTMGDFGGMFRHTVLSIVVPVTTTPRSTDYVILHYPISRIRSAADSLAGTCSLGLWVLYLLSLILPLGFYVLFYRPFINMLRISDAYISGSRTISPISGNDEMALLRKNLDFLAEEMNRTGEYQRKFLSNISHDFRSPLTSIKGYAEAMLDGTIPAESQEKYLNIILTEAERLTHLTQNVLTMNNLNEKGMLLEKSVFDINEVIRSCVASMEIQCRKKDILPVLSLAPGALYVNADKEKIQQVIYNLLDNAIKFSYPHSEITIRSARKLRRIFVSVKDNGEGIPNDQLSRIWTRFYKSDTSRGRDKKGTGLGLSIVREIILAHEQNINVISTEGVGSEFIFTLDKGSF